MNDCEQNRADVISDTVTGANIAKDGHWVHTPIAYTPCILCGEPLYLYDLSDSYWGHTPEVCLACKDLWAELKAQKQR